MAPATHGQRHQVTHARFIQIQQRHGSTLRPTTPGGRMSIYFVERDDEAVKIGTTKRGVRRILELEAQYGLLAIMAVIPGGYPEERKLHDHFSSLRLHGEWFRSDEQLTVHMLDLRRAHWPETQKVITDYIERSKTWRAWRVHELCRVQEWARLAPGFAS